MPFLAPSYVFQPTPTLFMQATISQPIVFT
jgi:hypothetical protein